MRRSRWPGDRRSSPATVPTRPATGPGRGTEGKADQKTWAESSVGIPSILRSRAPQKDSSAEGKDTCSNRLLRSDPERLDHRFGRKFVSGRGEVNAVVDEQLRAVVFALREE